MNFVLLFVLSVIGLTNILVESTIKDIFLENKWVKPVVEWLKNRLPEKVVEATTCHQCMGFWVGLVLGALLLNPWYSLIHGFAGSAIASTYHRIFVLAEEYVLSQTQIVIDDND